MRRLQIGGAELPTNDKSWLDENICLFDDLKCMSRLDSGFPGMQKAQWVAPNPDDVYDELAGDPRLAALEKSLNSTERRWDDDPAERASDWIRQEGRTAIVLSELEHSAEAGRAYPSVWDRFGWSHTPSEGSSDQDLHSSGSRVLTLLSMLPKLTIAKAIEGISFWLSTWEKYIVSSPMFVDVWMRIWPIAADATDKRHATKQAEESDIGSIVGNNDDREPLDTLNDPAGRMVGAFLMYCVHVKDTGESLVDSKSYTRMRDAITKTGGHSGLVARHRVLEFATWFLQIDPQWARGTLFKPLLDDSSDALALWDAMALRTQSKAVLSAIGDQMLIRAADQDLSRRARRTLAWNVVLETLFSLREETDPSIPNPRVTQMLRSLDDEVRAHVAYTLKRLVDELASSPDEEPDRLSREQIFDMVVQPFLESVWPQEQSLASVGVARSFAELPSACGDRFAEAVNAIERFLVPFDCWALHDFDLHGDDGDERRLSLIDTREKADALLRLLDKSVGTQEGAVVPYDLSQALEQVRQVDRNIHKTRTYRRLATLAR